MKPPANANVQTGTPLHESVPHLVPNPTQAPEQPAMLDPADLARNLRDLHNWLNSHTKR